MVYLVDDNHPFRRSTALVLETSGIEVRDFASAEALLAELEKDRAAPAKNCVVSDMRMPQMSGLALLEELQRRKYDAPVIFITAHGDVALAVEAMRRGAANFIEKPFTIEVLIQAIQLATAEEPPPPADNQDPRLAALSDREKQVLELVVAGKSNKVIGDILGISTKTVELHRASLMTKLSVRTLPDLVKVYLGYK